MANKNFYESLLKEIALWREEGVISAEQARTLAGRYRKDAALEKESGPNNLIGTIAVLGSLLLGIGIILFFAANWRVIPRPGKLSIVIFYLVAVNSIGYHIRFTRGNYPRVGYGLLFLGMLLFGSAIFLVAQAYHINAHFPNGFLLWGLGVIPMAYLLKSRVGAALAVIIMGVWLELEVTYMRWGASDSFVLFISILMAYGMLLAALGRLHRGSGRFGRLEDVYIFFGVSVIMGATFVFSFKGVGAVYADGGMLSRDMKLVFFYLALVLSSVALFAYAYLREGRERTSAALLMSACLLIIITAVHIAFPEKMHPFVSSHEEGIYFYPILYNILLLAETVGALALGYIERKPWLINTVMAFFILFICSRYFEYFWELLPGSTFFMLGGIILIAGGILLEKKRRKVVALIKS